MKNNWLLEIIKNLFKKEEEPEYPTGLVPSLPDFRDLQASDIFGSINLTQLPETYMIPYILPVKNQGSYPACVGFTCATIKDEKERREKNDVEFDGLWIYREAKKIDGIPNIQGTYFRTGLEILRKIGAKPTATSVIQGLPAIFKIGGYARVDCNIEAIKRAIFQSGAIMGGFYLYSNGSWSNAYIKKTSNNIVTAHAVAIIGWNKDHLIFQNSWGEQWGDKGLGYFNSQYMPYECWAVISDMPTELLPNIEKPKYNFTKDLFIGSDENQDIKALQDYLKYLGCMAKTQESTGYFGSITLQAVKIFQQRYNINPVNGRVGPLTREKLNSL